MSSDSMLVFQEANATQMAEVFRKRVAVVKNSSLMSATALRAASVIGRVSLVRRAMLR